ncbi:hypothetical protein KP509_01G084200 [Ceratopteris richardii]|uniref:mRNA export factor GLE1 n=1 Tax=Ceratopteris richardii TaxID=49495 RepID=A0A8T2VI93_CERRI|nr:hypothetical protein KP509_01G084200 [Ceratopteris richardii]
MAFPESLNLVPGTRKSVSPEILNPYPDWSLKELSEELNTLSLKFHQMHQSEEFLGPPKSTPAFRFSLQDLSTIADFGREGRPFRICAFDDGSDSDEDDDTSEVSLRPKPLGPNILRIDTGEVQLISTETISAGSEKFHDNISCLCKPWLLRRSEVPGGLMLELEHERLQRVQEEIRQRRSIFESSFEEEKMKATASIQKVIKEEESRKQMAHRLDQQYLRSIAEVRDTHLSALQREHEQHSQVEERKLRKEAEALKKEILAREERERQEKLQAEAEAKREAEAKKNAKAAKEQRAKQNAAEEKAVSNSSAQLKATEGPKPIVTQTAADLENMRLMNLESRRQISQSLQMNMNFKKILKDHERNLAKLLQQVSATHEQVRTKSLHLLNELAPSSHQPFAIITFASKLMSQCETQVSKLPSFAFALAQVVVNVSSRIPEVMDIVLATMNDVCIFTVPKYFVYRKVAGFRLCQVYNRSFMKLLDAIVTQFIVALKKQGDPDSNAVVSRLETYIATKQYLKEPNGRAMPRTDESTSLRC